MTQNKTKKKLGDTVSDVKTKPSGKLKEILITQTISKAIDIVIKNAPDYFQMLVDAIDSISFLQYKEICEEKANVPVISYRHYVEWRSLVLLALIDFNIEWEKLRPQIEKSNISMEVITEHLENTIIETMAPAYKLSSFDLRRIIDASLSKSTLEAKLIERGTVSRKPNF